MSILALAGSSDSFMGQLIIPLSDLDDGEAHERWYKLGAREGSLAANDKIVQGEILLELQYTFIKSWTVAYGGVAAYKRKEYKACHASVPFFFYFFFALFLLSLSLSLSLSVSLSLFEI